MHLITDNTKENMARRGPFSYALSWSRALELITLTNIRIGYAWSRMPWFWWMK